MVRNNESGRNDLLNEGGTVQAKQKEGGWADEGVKVIDGDDRPANTKGGTRGVMAELWEILKSEVTSAGTCKGRCSTCSKRKAGVC